MVSQAFADRPNKKLILFDVDGTLTPARQVCITQMNVPTRLREQYSLHPQR